MNKNQVEVKLQLPIEDTDVLHVMGSDFNPIDGPFCVRFMNGHSNIVRDLGQTHINVIMETCEGRCLLNLNDDLTPEILDGKKVLTINMLFN